MRVLSRTLIAAAAAEARYFIVVKSRYSPSTRDIATTFFLLPPLVVYLVNLITS